MQSFMKLDMKKKSDSKAVIISVWGLKTSLGQYAPKASFKGLTKPYVQSPGFNFHKKDPIF